MATRASISRSSATSATTNTSRINDSADWELHFSEIRGCDLLVDALFGTGLKTPLSGLFETVVADINAADLPVVSIDLPSGLSADSVEPPARTSTRR